MNRFNFDHWNSEGRKDLEQAAVEKVATRLAAYQAPDFDPGLKKDLVEKATQLADGAPLKMA